MLKRPKAPKRNKTQPSSGSASKTKGGGLFGFSKRKTGSKRGVTQVGGKSGSQRLKPVPPSMRPKKPVRGTGGGKPKPDYGQPVPFPGNSSDMKPDTGRPVGRPTLSPKPPKREKLKKAPRPKVIKETKTGPVKKKRPLSKPIKETKGGPVKKKRRPLAQPRPINPTGRVSYRGPRMIRRR